MSVNDSFDSGADKTKRWQFGLRDVLLWSFVVCLTGGWINDHWNSQQELKSQRWYYHDRLSRESEANEDWRRRLDRFRPFTGQKISSITSATRQCSGCSVAAADRPPDEVWYSFHALEGDGPAKDLHYCTDCAENKVLIEAGIRPSS